MQDETREGILAAADRLFERYGYRKTTVDEIAVEAGIGKGSIYLHFASKEEIGICWLARLHDSLFQDLTAIASSPEAPADRLIQFLVQRVMLRFDIFANHQRSMDEALAKLKCHLEERKKAFHAKEADLIAGIIQSGIAGGSFASADPADDGRSMIVATNALLPYSLRPEQLGDREFVESQARDLAKLLLRSVLLPSNSHG